MMKGLSEAEVTQACCHFKMLIWGQKKNIEWDHSADEGEKREKNQFLFAPISQPQILRSKIFIFKVLRAHRSVQTTLLSKNYLYLRKQLFGL